MQKIVIFACFLAASAIMAIPAAAAEKKPLEIKKPIPAPETAPAATQTQVNEITKAFTNSGVLSCASRINQVANFLGNNTIGTGAFLFLGANKDAQIASTSMELIGKDKKSVYASASFAPNQANGCGAVYEAVSWWPEKCDIVATKQFNGKKAKENLKQNISLMDIGPTSRVFFMPTSDGCISIKKELVQ